ncbi:hypothetical protein PHMEG_00020601, partial [Phytophthora megakarya]
MDKIKVGGELKPLNDANPNWKLAVSNFKGSEKFKNVNEREVAKFTEGVAKVVAKNPSKWSTMKKILVATYEVNLTPIEEAATSVLRTTSEKLKTVTDDVAAATKKMESAKVAAKLDEAGTSNAAKVEGATSLGKKSAEAAAVDKKVEAAMDKIKAGGELKSLNDANPKWKKLVSDLKKSEKLKNVNEKEVTKITEGVAKVVVKDSSKWSTMKKILVATYGVALTALIATALIKMSG